MDGPLSDSSHKSLYRQKYHGRFWNNNSWHKSDKLLSNISKSEKSFNCIVIMFNIFSRARKDSTESLVYRALSWDRSHLVAFRIFSCKDATSHLLALFWYRSPTGICVLKSHTDMNFDCRKSSSFVLVNPRTLFNFACLSVWSEMAPPSTWLNWIFLDKEIIFLNFVTF